MARVEGIEPTLLTGALRSRLRPLNPCVPRNWCTAANQRNVPCVDGPQLRRRIFTSQGWSLRRCVRPVSEVRMTAGHNALRGSYPGQNLAFDHALAHVGWNRPQHQEPDCRGAFE